MNQQALSAMAHHPVWLFACHHPDTPENERRLSRRQRDKTIQFIGAFGGGTEDLTPAYMSRAVTKRCSKVGVDISQPWRIIGEE